MKTIFFDWGGVVADDPGDDFLTNLLLDIGARRDQINQIHGLYMVDFMCGNITEQEYWLGLKNKYGFSIPDSITDEFKKWNGLKANEKILSLVDEVKELGWQTALLTNVIRPTYDVLKDAGYYHKFDLLIASCDEGCAKPDQEIYDIALKRANTKPEDSVFIDDKQKNIDQAQRMGIKVILAESPQQIIRDVKAAIVQ